MNIFPHSAVIPRIFALAKIIGESNLEMDRPIIASRFGR